MNKQSSVDWLIDQVEDYIGLIPLDIIEQAKEMEKQQITNAYWDGGQDIPLTENRCEQYYNETFKSE